MGRIGQAVARRARGFSMRLLYHDTRRAPEDVERELGLEFADAKTLLRESDFISLHVPLTPETRHLIGAAQLALMKPTAILVNSSRGPVVDEAALAEALERRHDRRRRPGRLRARTASSPEPAEAGKCRAGAAYRQRLRGYPPQNVHDGSGERRGSPGRPASSEPAQPGSLGSC